MRNRQNLRDTQNVRHLNNNKIVLPPHGDDFNPTTRQSNNVARPWRRPARRPPGPAPAVRDQSRGLARKILQPAIQVWYNSSALVTSTTNPLVSERTSSGCRANGAAALIPSRDAAAAADGAPEELLRSR